MYVIYFYDSSSFTNPLHPTSSSEVTREIYWKLRERHFWRDPDSDGALPERQSHANLFSTAHICSGCHRHSLHVQQLEKNDRDNSGHHHLSDILADS